jgi:hypothetical protein
LVTDKYPDNPAANPDPFTVKVPGVPVTVADPLFAMITYVPAAKAEEVVTVTGAEFKANVPALAPETVNGALVELLPLAPP